MTVLVRLDTARVEKVRAIAAARFNGHRARGTQHRWNRDQAEHTIELEAAAIGAEVAVADFLGLPWHDVGRPDSDGDGGMPGVQVRYTERPDGRLLVHDSDDDYHVFVLVTGGLLGFLLVGARRGLEAKQLGVWRELRAGRPCYVVERDDLLPVDLLRHR